MSIPQLEGNTALTGEPRLDLTSVEARTGLAKLITRLFDLWDLSTADRLELLGQSANSRANLTKYRKGAPLPNLRDLLDRAGWLLSIHKSLRLLYPHNETLRYMWINRRNKAFDNLTPLQVIRSEGIIGMAKVARYLDYQRGR
ncbi:MAG TPA: MbcA/ParS/Xre antitoxin family protein [Geobacteraceae bacterium]|mgnify:CR=1 FL=1|nr:MbcA/ParS/Xre antitoxin family protein [Geobacteraceae bacterium]